MMLVLEIALGIVLGVVLLAALPWLLVAAGIGLAIVAIALLAVGNYYVAVTPGPEIPQWIGKIVAFADAMLGYLVLSSLYQWWKGRKLNSV